MGDAGWDPMSYADPFGLWPLPDPLTIHIATALANAVISLAKTVLNTTPEDYVNGVAQISSFVALGSLGGSDGVATDEAEAGDEYWIVDVDARVIERWRASDERPEILDVSLQWRPVGASVPFTLDLPDYFAAVMPGEPPDRG